MAWNPDPKIRKLVDFAKDHKFSAVIGICIHSDGMFEVLSVRDTAQNCKKTKSVGDEVFKMIQAGSIEFPEY